jgi:hypothetical protein
MAQRVPSKKLGTSDTDWEDIGLHDFGDGLGPVEARKHHTGAIVAKSAVIGGAILSKSARIASQSTLGQNALVRGKIGSNVTTGYAPVCLSKSSIGDNVQIGDHVFVRHGAIIAPNISIPSRTSIGSNSTVSCTPLVFSSSLQDSRYPFLHTEETGLEDYNKMTITDTHLTIGCTSAPFKTWFNPDRNFRNPHYEPFNIPEFLTLLNEAISAHLTYITTHQTREKAGFEPLPEGHIQEIRQMFAEKYDQVFGIDG